MGHAVPGRRAAEGREGATTAAVLERHAERHRRAVPEVPAPRLPRAVVRQHRSGSSARATARSTTASARRRAARRLAAWTASRVTVDAGDRHRSTPAPCSRARRSAPTPPARRPRVRTASPAGWHGVIARCRPRRPDHRASSSGRPRVGWLVYCLVNSQPAQAGARLRDRAGPEPQAVLRRRRRSKAAARRASAARSGCCSSSWSSGCRCTGCSSPAARRAPSSGYDTNVRRAGAQSCSPPTAQRRLQLRRLPRRHEGHRRRRRLHASPTRRPARCRSVNWNAPALNTVLYRFSDDEVTLHPHLRPPVLADVGVGHRRRRPDERPADRRTSSPTCDIDPGADARPSQLREGTDGVTQGARPTPIEARAEAAVANGSTRASARRCSTSTSTAAPTRAPAATRKGWSLRRPAVSRAAVRWDRT